jgi:hypothetical protein
MVRSRAERLRYVRDESRCGLGPLLRRKKINGNMLQKRSILVERRLPRQLKFRVCADRHLVDVVGFKALVKGARCDRSYPAPDSLEKRACPCYDIVRRHIDRLVPLVPPNGSAAS